MIITRQYAKMLITANKATEEGLMASGHRYPEGDLYVIVNRHDLCRTDHYLATGRDVHRLTSETP